MNGHPTQPPLKIIVCSYPLKIGLEWTNINSSSPNSQPSSALGTLPDFWLTATNPKSFFHQNKFWLLLWLLWQKNFNPGFLLQMPYPLKVSLVCGGMKHETHSPVLSSMGQKNTQLPSFERVRHLKEKFRAKSPLTIVNRAVEKVYLCKRKKLGG